MTEPIAEPGRKGFKAEEIRFDVALDSFFEEVQRKFAAKDFIVSGTLPAGYESFAPSILYARKDGLLAQSRAECLQIGSRGADKSQLVTKFELTIEGLGEENFSFDALLVHAIAIPEDLLAKFAQDLNQELSSRLKKKILDLRDYVVAMSLRTRDITSFLHRAVTEGLKEYFSFGAASAFYFDYELNNLILGATTGLSALRGTGVRRSQVRYDSTSGSWVRKCFDIGKPILEVAADGERLKQNTHGEIDTAITNRLYLPIDVRRNLRERLSSTYGDQASSNGRVGVIRILNMSRNGIINPPSLLDMYFLEHFCEYIAVLGARYIRYLSAVHDQEKATHGFTTDLSTLGLRLQLYALETRATLERYSGRKLPDTLATLATEIDGLLTLYERTFFAVQEGMSFQLETVSEFADGVIGEDGNSNSICEKPFVEVILRVAEAAEYISANHGRRRASITFGGHSKPTEEFMRLPRLAIPPRTLVLAVRNIVENAIKYTSKTEIPKVDISWSIVASEISIRVSDKGIGIAETDVPKLFRESFRARNALATATRGNGYGLFVSKRGLQKYFGDISYIGPNSGGLGSIFQIKAPLAK